MNSEKISDAIQVTEYEGITVLSVRESSSFALPQEFIRRVKELLRDGRCTLIADLSEIRYINTNWVGALAASNASAMRAGGKLVLVNVCCSIERVLKTAGLGKHILMCPDLVSAAKHLSIAAE